MVIQVTRKWEISKKFMTGLRDEKLQRSLLSLYTGEQFAMNPPTVKKLRAKCRDFLTMMSINPRNQTYQNQGSGYHKSTQTKGVMQPQHLTRKMESHPAKITEPKSLRSM